MEKKNAAEESAVAVAAPADAAEKPTETKAEETAAVAPKTPATEKLAEVAAIAEEKLTTTPTAAESAPSTTNGDAAPAEKAAAIESIPEPAAPAAAAPSIVAEEVKIPEPVAEVPAAVAETAPVPTTNGTAEKNETNETSVEAAKVLNGTAAESPKIEVKTENDEKCKNTFAAASELVEVSQIEEPPTSNAGGDQIQKTLITESDQEKEQVITCIETTPKELTSGGESIESVAQNSPPPPLPCSPPPSQVMVFALSDEESQVANSTETEETIVPTAIAVETSAPADLIEKSLIESVLSQEKPKPIEEEKIPEIVAPLTQEPPTEDVSATPEPTEQDHIDTSSTPEKNLLTTTEVHIIPATPEPTELKITPATPENPPTEVNIIPATPETSETPEIVHEETEVSLKEVLEEPIQETVVEQQETEIKNEVEEEEEEILPPPPPPQSEITDIPTSISEIENIADQDEITAQTIALIDEVTQEAALLIERNQQESAEQQEFTNQSGTEEETKCNSPPTAEEDIPLPPSLPEPEQLLLQSETIPESSSASSDNHHIELTSPTQDSHKESQTNGTQDVIETSQETAPDSSNTTTPELSSLNNGNQETTTGTTNGDEVESHTISSATKENGIGDNHEQNAETSATESLNGGLEHKTIEEMKADHQIEKISNDVVTQEVAVVGE